jgi:hypothetical protein
MFPLLRSDIAFFIEKDHRTNFLEVDEFWILLEKARDITLKEARVTTNTILTKKEFHLKDDNTVDNTDQENYPQQNIKKEKVSLNKIPSLGLARSVAKRGKSYLKKSNISDWKSDM